MRGKIEEEGKMETIWQPLSIYQPCNTGDYYTQYRDEEEEKEIHNKKIKKKRRKVRSKKKREADRKRDDDNNKEKILKIQKDTKKMR